MDAKKRALLNRMKLFPERVRLVRRDKPEGDVKFHVFYVDFTPNAPRLDSHAMGVYKCSLCGKRFVGYPGSAEPIKEGACCRACFEHDVIKARREEEFHEMWEE